MRRCVSIRLLLMITKKALIAAAGRNMLRKHNIRRNSSAGLDEKGGGLRLASFMVPIPARRKHRNRALSLVRTMSIILE